MKRVPRDPSVAPRILSPLPQFGRTVLLVGILGTLLLFESPDLRGQSAVVQGIVIEAGNGRPIPHATILHRETGIHASADTAGLFRFAALPPGPATLSVRRVGYQSADCRLSLAAGSTQRIRIVLSTDVIEMNGIVVSPPRMVLTDGRSPAPSDIIDGEALAARPFPSAADALAESPGVGLSRDGPWGTGVSIRGIERNGVVLLVDGVRVETAHDLAGAFSLIDRWSVARMEVLKGPASAMHGAGALGGVVEVFRFSPLLADAFSWRARGGVSAASANGETATHLEGGITGPRAGIWLSGTRRSAGLLRTPAGRMPNSQYRDDAIGFSTVIRTWGDQSLRLALERVDAHDVGIPGGEPFAATAVARYTGARRDHASLLYSVPDLCDAIPLVRARIARQVISRNVEVVPAPAVTLTPHAVHTLSSLDLAASIVPSEHMLLETGIDVWQRDLESRRERTDRSTRRITHERPLPASDARSAGAFAQVRWDAIPGWLTVETGARADRNRVRARATATVENVTDLNGALLPMPVNPVGWSPRTVQQTSWSVDGGVHADVSDQLRLSALVSTGYRSPSLEERFQYIDLGSTVRIGNPDLDPERALCVDFGVAGSAGSFDGRCDFFVNAITDLVAEVPAEYEGRDALVQQNVGRAVLTGMDVGLSATVLERLTIAVRGCLVRGEDTRLHRPLPRISPYTGSATVGLQVPGAGHIAVESRFAADQHRVATGEVRTGGYVVWGARYTTAPIPLLGGWLLLHGGVENLFDRGYRLHLSTVRGANQLEAGRSVFVTAEFAIEGR
jgi:hemoglobin/transferrin/lactoferrin receptor protein